MQFPDRPDAVTEREQEVIRLVRRGLLNKEIADRLCIADSTVRHHLTSIWISLVWPIGRSCWSKRMGSVLFLSYPPHGESLVALSPYRPEQLVRSTSEVLRPFAGSERDRHVGNVRIG